MRTVQHLTFSLAIIAAIVGCGDARSEKAVAPSAAPADKKPITIFAAASATNALDEIKAAFAEKTGAEVRASYAASSTLAQQIEKGAEVDLFLSADVRWADYVAGKTPPARRRNLLGNRLVIVAPASAKTTLNKPEDLLSDKIKHLALGDPEAVPAGRYAKQALASLGLWEKLKSKVVPAEDVRHALTYVETAAAEAGIVYATDAAVSKKVAVVAAVPADLTEPVRYPLLLLKRGAERESAKAFYDYLGSPEATTVFERFGFSVLSDAGAK